MASSVCRVCLAGNIKMQNVDNVNLVEVFEKLTNIKLGTESNAGLPNSMCYICHRLLQKCYMFSEMARRSDQAMRVMLYSGIEVTHKAIEKLFLATSPTLSVTPVRHTPVTDLNSTNILPTIKEEHVAVKIEETDYLNSTITFATDVVVKIEETEFQETIFAPDEDTKDIDGSVELLENNLNDVENKSTDINNLYFCCDLCNKKVFSRYQLIRHMRKHVVVKPFSCSKCSKKYVRKHNLIAHMVIHNREKPYSCKQCDKAFDYKSILTVHMRSHTGEKPYSCSRCSKTFTTKSSFTRHVRTHTGVKQFSCLECDKAFSRKSDLKIHMRSHRRKNTFMG